MENRGGSSHIQTKRRDKRLQQLQANLLDPNNIQDLVSTNNEKTHGNTTPPDKQ